MIGIWEEFGWAVQLGLSMSLLSLGVALLWIKGIQARVMLIDRRGASLQALMGVGLIIGFGGAIILVTPPTEGVWNFPLVLAGFVLFLISGAFYAHYRTERFEKFLRASEQVM